MSYGTLSKNPIKHYNKIYYTIGRTTFEPIHVFKTNPNSESIAPAVCLTDSKKHLSEMNPPTAVIGSTANVMAKTMLITSYIRMVNRAIPTLSIAVSEAIPVSALKMMAVL